MSSVLVTGGTGFLGSALAQRLLSAGHRVRVFDVEERKYLPEGAEFVRGDMRTLDDVRRAMTGITDVFHCAFVQSLSKRPEEEKWQANVLGTQNFLNVATDQRIRKFVHTSTIEVYGTHAPFPCTEAAPMDEPTGWYGRHKVECEFLCHRAVESGLPVTWLRLPTICGPGAYNHGPLLDLMDRILQSQPLPVAGLGKTLGSVVHLDDALDGFLLAWEKDASIGEAFNIASDIPASQKDMILAMAKAVGSRSILLPVPKLLIPPFFRLARKLKLTDCPEYQMGYLLYDAVYSVDKAKRLLGFRPKYSAADSFAHFIEGYVKDKEYIRQRQQSY